MARSSQSRLGGDQAVLIHAYARQLSALSGKLNHDELVELVQIGAGFYCIGLKAWQADRYSLFAALQERWQAHKN